MDHSCKIKAPNSTKYAGTIFRESDWMENPIIQASLVNVSGPDSISPDKNQSNFWTKHKQSDVVEEEIAGDSPNGYSTLARTRHFMPPVLCNDWPEQRMKGRWIQFRFNHPSCQAWRLNHFGWCAPYMGFCIGRSLATARVLNALSSR